MTSSETTDATPFWRKMLAWWWYIWGMSLCYRGNRTAERSFYEAGVDSFARASKLWPAFAAPLYRSGIIKGREMGHYSAAIIDLNRATRLAPEWAEPYLQRGLFHRFNHNPVEAISELSEYIRMAEPGFWRDEAERQIAMIRLEMAETMPRASIEPLY